MIETTIDKLLGGRFAVEQPAKGYRIAVDTLLLASAIPALEGQSVLELGCGVGGVMLALATRVAGVHIVGVELQAEMAALCQSNIARNGFDDRLSVQIGDVAALPDELVGVFDHVMMNPPYHDHRTHSVSAVQAKRLAHAESDDADLVVWIAGAARCLKDSGVMTLIHRGDRLDEICAIAARHFGAIEVKPIVSKPDAPAKRVIVRAVNASMLGADKPRIVSPLCLYNLEAKYSQEAEAVLREAQPLVWER